MMEEALYLITLQDEVRKTVESYHFNPSHVIFQYDYDPKYTAKSVKQWLSMQTSDVLTWPPRSPDLTPMEHVWALAKHKLN